MPEDVTPIQRLQALLTKLFQLDLSDLDFGIYRLLRIERDEIEAFLNEQLPGAVDEAFSAVTEDQRRDAEAAVATLATRLREDVAEDALYADGSVREQYRDNAARAIRELIEEYDAARTRIDSIRTSEGQTADVFNHLYEFFRRYYEDGDFIPKRRITRQGHERYVIPYNGEETLLHWANRGQHYVKNAEVFRDYAFRVEGDLIAEPCRVRFVLSSASVPKGDTKGDARYFFPLAEDVEWDATKRTLLIPFHYRRPTEAEAEGFERTGVQELILRESLVDLRAAIPDGDIRAALLPSDGSGEATDDLEPEVPPLLGHLRRFVRRNTADYFVHRDLAAFLERELEFYIKDQILHLADLEGDLRARQRMLRVLRSVAGTIITFLAQLEDVQKRLFEKRNFVLSADYLVLISALPRDLWADVIANEAQVEEWERLFRIDLDEGLANSDGSVTEAFLEQHPTLVVSTALFDDDFRHRVLASFDDLENATGGILVHSENYQALRLLEPRFRGEIKCIYIDPPYNTGSDDFLYKDRYQHSSWLTMMEERLRLGRGLLGSTGSLFLSLDDQEVSNARMLLQEIFGSSNDVATVVWQKRYSRDNRPAFGTVHDYLLHFARSLDQYATVRNRIRPSEESLKVYRNPNADPQGRWRPIPMTAQGYRPNQMYEITTPSGAVHTPPPGRCWSMVESEFLRLREAGRIWFGADQSGQPNVIRYLSEVEGFVPWSWWPHEEVGHTDEAKKELYDLLGKGNPFDTPKPSRLIARVVHIASDPGEWILDFFAGSGTTASAVIGKAREGQHDARRFLLVEVGTYFDEILVDRVSRNLYSAEWTDGVPSNPSACNGHLHPLIKILRLESYEDSLHNLVSAETLERVDSRQPAFQTALGEAEYRIRYLAKLPMEASASLLNVEKLAHPFRYELEVLTDDGPEIRTVDLVETFNLVYGLRVRRVGRWVNEEDGEDGRRYTVVIGEDAEGQRTLILWRDMENLDPALERAFLEPRIEEAAETPFDIILINGDSTIPGVQSLDPVFKARICEGESG